MDGHVIVNDIIVAIGDVPVTSVEELISAIEAFDVGDSVPVTLQRVGSDGKAFLVNVAVWTY